MSSDGERDRPRNKWNKKDSNSPNRSFDQRNNHKRFNGNSNRGGRFGNGNDVGSMIPVSSPRDSNSNRGGRRPYRSLRNSHPKSPKNGDVSESGRGDKSSHWRGSKGRTPPKSSKKILIEPEQLSNLVAGDHVEITTKHNQIIDGIVYCSIPQVPPLCIIHHYNPAQTKNVYIVSLNEISRCIKFDEPKQPKRDVELRPIDNERANEILERNLAERKAKMDTLNIAVEDSTQGLFDFMYRTLPNKCVWRGTTITFPDSKVTIEAPYDAISLNGMARNKSVDYG